MSALGRKKMAKVDLNASEPLMGPPSLLQWNQRSVDSDTIFPTSRGSVLQHRCAGFCLAGASLSRARSKAALERKRRDDFPARRAVQVSKWKSSTHFPENVDNRADYALVTNRHSKRRNDKPSRKTRLASLIAQRTSTKRGPGRGTADRPRSSRDGPARGASGASLPQRPHLVARSVEVKGKLPLLRHTPCGSRPDGPVRSAPVQASPLLPSTSKKCPDWEQPGRSGS